MVICVFFKWVVDNGELVARRHLCFFVMGCKRQRVCPSSLSFTFFFNIVENDNELGSLSFFLIFICCKRQQANQIHRHLFRWLC
jgi:hypothetical protein